MAKKRKCSLQVPSDDGKRTLYGTAAQLHYIAENGGWDAFMEKTASDAAKLAVKHAFREMDKAKFKVTSNKNRKSS